MSNDLIQQDLDARRRALDIRESFIVQAPAGSGKTGLLIQRYLALLATVERPEQILAITFTRKAASEMRERVLSALSDARSCTAPTDPFELQTWQLASKVIDIDRTSTKNGLFAAQNIAQRLRIQTIDSLCSELVARMPITSRMGNAILPVENSEPLLRETARRVLKKLEDESDIAASTEVLLQHLDNDFAVVETLLMRMLARRDQWLRHLTDRDKPDLQRAELESGWRELVIDRLTDLRDAIAVLPQQELCELARYAAGQIKELDSPILVCKDLHGFPDAEPEAMPQWRGIAALLLTNKGEWRTTKGININTGFPPALKSKADAAENNVREGMKKRMQAFVEMNAADTQLAQKLRSVRELPTHGFMQAQWQVLQALLDLLPDAVGTLRQVFAESGQCDFAEIAQGALLALGDADAPTDLMLALDYRIQHILIDEFQDTSVSQFELLERLTAGWQPEDGRTLFIVGDPMQSIYRFREADVSLFWRAQFIGIGDLRPVPLLLSRNFRSQQGIVEWVNRTFAKVFPAASDPASGAVNYSPSGATRDALPGVAVHIHPLIGTDWKTQQAQQIADLISTAQRADAGQTIAVLARSRAHLAQIVQVFNQRQIPFAAVEIDQLSQRQLVIDLSALTRAMLNPADRTAWLSVLRAPWCGLRLSDLGAIAETESLPTVWQLLHEKNIIAQLSSDGVVRVDRLLAVMSASLPQRDRVSLRAWIESCWLALGGPACAATDNDLNDATSFFDMLDAFGSQEFSMEALDAHLEKLYAQPSEQSNASIQIMTMHKSKGLEFDTVILPSLSSKQRPNDSQLLLWQEYVGRSGANRLLLAPISARGSDTDRLYLLAKNLESQRDLHESQRLLYVAATRAKKRLYIFALAEEGNDRQIRKPNSSSLLFQLWPVVESQFAAAIAKETATGKTPSSIDVAKAIPFIRRLKTEWRLPAV
ncbi:MAG: UvrD-helicase domain-containing protein, partial [Burkholderiales bacterium]